MAEITSTQQISYAIKAFDRLGHPAALENIVWASSNSEVVTVEPSANGLSAVVKAQVPGDATISVEADGDVGSGVVPLAGTAAISVVPAAATAIQLTEGAIEEQA